MKQRAFLLPIVMIVGWVFLIGPAGAAARRHAHRVCGPKAAVTLRRNRWARVFELPAEGRGRDQPTYGCLVSTRHWWRLDRPSGWSYLNPKTLVLRVPWVAYSITSMGVDGGGSGISVRNLKTGAETQSYDAVTLPPNPAPETFTSVAKIVLQQDGDVAWIGEEASITGAEPPRLQVELGDSAGLSIVDEGSGIDPDSLSLNGSMLTWSNAGATHTAELP
jgi:hypothetical protein